MGAVNFNTNVIKTVNLNKTVDLNVNKAVTSFANIQGNLATAEASADAVGGGTGTGTPPQFGSFLIDDFDEDQEVTDTFNAADLGGNSSTVVIPSSPPAPVDGAPPDTDIPAAASRTLFIQTLGQGAPVIDPVGGLNTINPQNILNVRFDPQAFGNAFAQYESSTGAFDLTPLVDNAQILANAADGVPDDFISFTVNTFNPGDTVDGDPATARISVIFEDVNGEIALASSLLVGGFAAPITINAPLVAFLDEDLANALQPPGSVVPGSGGNILQIGVEDDADLNGVDGVDFDNITSITLVIEDRPGATLSEPLPGGIVTTNPAYGSVPDQFVFNGFGEERQSVTGTDLQLNLAEVSTFLPGEEREGNLAETDTFAQVSREGAFSFSESLAASNSFDFDLG